MSVNRDYFKDEVKWDGAADYQPSYEYMPNLPSLEAASGVVLRPLFGRDVMVSYVTFAHIRLRLCTSTHRSK